MKSLRLMSVLVSGALMVLSARPGPADFYVAPHGAADADGSMARPWDLQSALSHPAAVQPGATIWLRGGTYTGAFVSRLNGASGAPITVRAYRGERPILDNPSPDVTNVKAVLTVEGQHVVVRDLEVISSNPRRAAERPRDAVRPIGINVYGSHTKLINNIVHDTGDCIGHWVQSADAEISGNILFFCGWDAADRGHGHGLYVQNERGIKEIRDNIVFDQFSFGIHAYTEAGALDDLRFRRNVSFGAGVLSKTRARPPADLLVGGRKVVRRPIIEGNFTYHQNGSNSLGYRVGSENGTVTGNYFVGGKHGVALNLVAPENLSLSRNTFVGRFPRSDQYPDNTLVTAPKGIWRFVLPNAYEPNRATLVIYNWDGAPSVDVDVSAVLARGDRYALRNVQDYFVDVTSRTYGGDPIAVPMEGRSVGVPIGWPAPATTFPTFGVFVIEKVESTAKARGPQPR